MATHVKAMTAQLTLKPTINNIGCTNFSGLVCNNFRDFYGNPIHFQSILHRVLGKVQVGYSFVIIISCLLFITNVCIY